MRKKTITVSVTMNAYRNARIFAAQRDTNISAMTQKFLENLPVISRALTFYGTYGPRLASLNRQQTDTPENHRQSEHLSPTSAVANDRSQNPETQ